MNNIVPYHFIESVTDPKDEINKIIENSLAELSNRIHQQRCYAFCGAGVSMGQPSSMPSWKSMLTELLEVLSKRHPELNDNRGHIQSLLDQNDLVTAAELIQSSLLHANFDTLTFEINNILMRRDSATGVYSQGPIQPNTNHFLITRILFGHILTTNYDELLGDADRATGLMLYEPIDRISPAELEAALIRGSRLLIHMHGRLSTRSAIVLTRSDYNRAYGRSFFNDWLTQSLVTRSFLFLGYSLSDFDFVNLIRAAREQMSANLKIGPHFAILPRQDFPEIRRRFLNNNYNIHTIPLDVRGPEIARFLVRLHGKCARLAADDIRHPGTKILGPMAAAYCQAVKRTLGPDLVALILIDAHDSHTASIHYVNNAGHNQSVPIPVDSNGGLYRLFRDLSEVSYYYHGNRTQSTDPYHNHLAPLCKEAISSVLAAPLASQGKKVGMIVIGSRVQDAYARDHLDALLGTASKFADSYLDFLRREEATFRNSGKLHDFARIRANLQKSLLVKNATDLDYILYEADFRRGHLVAHYDTTKHDDTKQLGARWGPLVMTDLGHLATWSLHTGATLRFTHAADAQSFGRGVDAGTGLRYFGLEGAGNLCIIPIRAFGYVVAILAAWSNSPPEGERFHGTIFDRIKRLLRVYLNDYSVAIGGDDVAESFLSRFLTGLTEIQGQTIEEIKAALDNPTKRLLMIEWCLRALVEESGVTGLAKARLWLLGTDQKYHLVKSCVHPKAVFRNKPQVDGYADYHRTSDTGDRYTSYTVDRYTRDPYARPQSNRMFQDYPDPNTDHLDKAKFGSWLTGPIYFGNRTYDGLARGDTRLLGYLSVDDHFPGGADGLPVQKPVSTAQQHFQRCLVDLVTHVLATICDKVVPVTGLLPVPGNSATKGRGPSDVKRMGENTTTATRRRKSRRS